MKKLNLLVIASLSILATACVDDDFQTPALDNCVTLTKTKEVVDITSVATTTYAQYTNNDIIEAYVTSSDEAGNFYKSISFTSVDGTVGFSMPVDAYNLYTYFEPGRKVYVNMKDMYYVNENSSTLIGGLYNNETPADASDDKVGRVAGVDFKNIIKAS